MPSRIKARVLRSIKECLADYATHDAKYACDRCKGRQFRLVSLRDLGYCAGLPQLERAVIVLFRRESEVRQSLEDRRLTGPSLYAADWLKIFVNRLNSRKEYECLAPDEPNQRRIPDGRGLYLCSWGPYFEVRDRDVTARTCHSVMWATHERLMKRGQAGFCKDALATALVRELLGLGSILIEVRCGAVQISRGETEYAPFAALSATLLEEAMRCPM